MKTGTSTKRAASQVRAKKKTRKKVKRAPIIAKKKAIARDTEAQSVARLKEWRRSPIAFVRYNFDVEPDAWQRDVLLVLRDQPKIAMSACKGPGKSALLAWCGWWLLACFKDSKGIACSITGDNLRDNLWTELAIWYACSEWLQSAFALSAERITSRERPKTWWLSARSFPRDADKTAQANTLAGLHNAKGVVFVLLDEVGDYPDGVVVAAEGIFANEHISRAWLLAAGNPTQPGGPLHRISYDDETYYSVRITGDPEDEKRSPRISLKWAQEHIDTWGRDNAWVRVNVLGLEPHVGSNRMLGVVEVKLAQSRDVPALHYRSDPVIWGVDPARFGADEACCARRQGILCRPMLVWRGLEGTELATELGLKIMEAEKNGDPPDAIFIDEGGQGVSCYEHLKLLGWADIIFGVKFGGSPSDMRFGDKGSEMWFTAAQWVKLSTSCLPNDAILRKQLTERSLDYKMRNKRACLCVDSKEKLAADGIESPDRADAFVMTFHSPVVKRNRSVHAQFAEAAASRAGHCETEYEPYTR